MGPYQSIADLGSRRSAGSSTGSSFVWTAAGVAIVIAVAGCGEVRRAAPEVEVVFHTPRVSSFAEVWAVSETGRYVGLFESHPDTLSVLDMESGERVALDGSFDPALQDIQLSLDGLTVYAADRLSHELSVIRWHAGEVETLPLGAFEVSYYVVARGGTHVARTNGSDVVVVELATGSPRILYADGGYTESVRLSDGGGWLASLVVEHTDDWSQFRHVLHVMNLSSGSEISHPSEWMVRGAPDHDAALVSGQSMFFLGETALVAGVGPERTVLDLATGELRRFGLPNWEDDIRSLDRAGTVATIALRRPAGWQVWRDDGDGLRDVSAASSEWPALGDGENWMVTPDGEWLVAAAGATSSSVGRVLGTDEWFVVRMPTAW